MEDLTGKQLGSYQVVAPLGLGWLVGGILFTLATQVPVKPLSALLVVLAVLLGGATGGGVMFTQYRQR
jgi:hypothetical protein